MRCSIAYKVASVRDTTPIFAKIFLKVNLDGICADLKGLGNFLVAHSGGNMLENVPLPFTHFDIVRHDRELYLFYHPRCPQSKLLFD